jgi:hypothetical protein
VKKEALLAPVPTVGTGKELRPEVMIEGRYEESTTQAIIGALLRGNDPLSESILGH